ncbi:hypothetical protein [Streptomyces californicus]|uniref:hypothetical protein n=1 Tax=Streptomyces californicus TaxID=67351 RepID=UPI003830A7F1
MAPGCSKEEAEFSGHFHHVVRGLCTGGKGGPAFSATQPLGPAARRGRRGDGGQADPLDNSLGWSVRYHPEQGRTVLLMKDDDTSPVCHNDGITPQRLGGGSREPVLHAGGDQ